MSTTNTCTHTVGEVQSRDEPGKIFDRYVFEHPDTCSSCFQRIKAGHRRVVYGSVGHDKEDKATRSESVRQHETAPDEAGPEGICIGTRQVPNPEVAVYPTRTICESCGEVSGRAPDDTLSKKAAIGRSDALADRLLELGEPIGDTERQELKSAVGQLKSKPDLRGYDREIFSRATKVVVRRARTRSRTGGRS